MIITIFALLLSVTVILAQTPCNSPPQWQGRRYMYIEEANDYSRSFYSYDAVSKREKIVQETNVNGKLDAGEYIRLYSQNVEYFYNYNSKQCVKNTIKTTFREFGVPAGATYAGQAYYGASAVQGGSLLAQVWTANITDNEGNSGRYTGFWTVEGCAPIEITGTWKNYAVHSQFFDITLGISDPNAFIPRKECLGL